MRHMIQLVLASSDDFFLKCLRWVNTIFFINTSSNRKNDSEMIFTYGIVNVSLILLYNINIIISMSTINRSVAIIFDYSKYI